MQKTASLIHKQESIAQVEQQLISVREIFRLQNTQELKNAENVYLTPSEAKRPEASNR